MVDSRRELIAAGLFKKFTDALTPGGLITASRALKSYDQVDGVLMPALYQTQTGETYEETIIGLPGKRTMHFSLFLYTCDPQQPDVVPSTQLNNMITAVETCLAPCVINGKITLGGLAANVWIDGNIEIYEGVTQDGKSIAIIPVAAIIP